MDARFIAVLEIGSSKVKGAVARVDSDGGATLVASHEVKTLNCVRHGRVQNVQEVSAAVDEVLRRLENDPAVAPRRIRRVRIALGGRSTASIDTHAEITLPAEVQITPDIIERLKRDAAFGLPADRDVVAVIPRSYSVDGKPEVANIVGTFGRHVRANITVVLAAHDNRTNLERVQLTSDTSRSPIERVYVPRQLALARMALTPAEQQLGVALVDIGAETTTVSIHRDGSLQALSTLPMGGRNITRDIATGLAITEDQAEYIKCAQASAIHDPAADTEGNAAEVNCHAQARAGEIIANIVHRIEAAGFKTAELTGGIVLTGCPLRMNRMVELFESQTKMKVRVAPADNTVRPGNTSADPLADLDIMALAAWPGAADSDLTDLPKRQEEPAPHEQRPATGSHWQRPEIDDENLLEDDPDDEAARTAARAPKKPRKEEPQPVIDDDYDYDDKHASKGRYTGLRQTISRIGKALMGNKEETTDDIDE